MTQDEAILKAAGKLPQTFTLNQLVVAAFQEAPELFALEGFPKLVNNNKVLSRLMGKEGLVRTGKLQKVKTGVYKVPIRSKMAKW